MKPLALTPGDPSGIGPEIALGAWHARLAENTLPPFYLIGDPDFLRERAAQAGLSAPVEVIEPRDCAAAFAHALPMVATANRARNTPGQADSANAAVTIEAIETAVAHVRAGHATALVTGPVSKKPLYDAGFAFPGHTEFLAHLAEREFGQTAHSVMMLAGPSLRTVPVTVHVPLKDVASILTTELIVRTAEIVSGELRRRFGLDRPRLAVSGLNPHAGEDGSLGAEDASVIAPAVAALKDRGVEVVGPLPADTMFSAEARSRYDAALCMYHDQALIPVKTLAFDETVNVTLGLPFIRTSPDHGTAYDIAGKGVARANSLVAALKLAWNMAENEAQEART